MEEYGKCHPDTKQDGICILHSSETFEHGCGGAPIMFISNGTPRVRAMFQRGYPEFCYWKGEKRFWTFKGTPRDLTFQVGLTMKKVQQLVNDSNVKNDIKELFDIA